MLPLPAAIRKLPGIEADDGRVVDFKGKSQRGVIALLRGQRALPLDLLEAKMDEWIAKQSH